MSTKTNTKHPLAIPEMSVKIKFTLVLRKDKS